MEKLTNIHNNPSFYAGYYLNQVKEGSLGKRGDSHSEQNHASIISYLGEGGNLEIFEQISKLLERHRNQVALKTESDGELQLIIQRFKSQLQGYEDIADNKARKALSDHAYNSFFLTTIRKALRFQVTEEKNLVIQKMITMIVISLFIKFIHVILVLLMLLRQMRGINLLLKSVVNVIVKEFIR